MTFPVTPGRGLGFFILGASLHSVLTRLKAQPSTYPSIDLTYSSTDPVQKPVVLTLSGNGLRLRFDGPDQRLRLIEVLDFSKIHVTYKSKDLVKQPTTQDQLQPASIAGPTFRSVYHKLFGPSFPGEYTAPLEPANASHGVYVLSYPGIAFSFPLQASVWSPEKDFVSLLSSAAASPATSMAVFQGPSWPEARTALFTRQPLNPRSIALSLRGRDTVPDEIEEAMIHSAGRIELIRRNSPSFWIVLSESTPQDLVAELGPPDAIYRKNDRRISIHGTQSSNNVRAESRPSSASPGRYGTSPSDVAEHSSNQSYTDDSDAEGPPATQNDGSSMNPECFYNYFHHGFDAFISYPTTPSPPFPNSDDGEQSATAPLSNTLTVTKLLLHANVPGSYPFNRHRRSRWIINLPGTDQETAASTINLRSSPAVQPDTHNGSANLLNSETTFSRISGRLKEIWKPAYSSAEEERASQRGMVLNRGWGDSPESSVELLGGWEESTGDNMRNDAGTGSGEKAGSAAMGNSHVMDGVQGLGNTELFGFPGMLFEVLKNGTHCMKFRQYLIGKTTGVEMSIEEELYTALSS